MTEPTDAELDALRQADSGALNFVTLRQFRVIARAVLAKWGQPAVAEKPRAWLSPWRKDQVTTDYDAYGKHGIPLYTHPQPTQPQAGAVPLTDEMASKAGRALSDLYATECGVDKEDNWKVYGSDFIDTARLVLEAVGIKGGQHGADN